MAILQQLLSVRRTATAASRSLLAFPQSFCTAAFTDEDASRYRTQSKTHSDPFNRTGENKEDVEGPDHCGRRRDASVLNPPCSEHAGIVTDRGERY